MTKIVQVAIDDILFDPEGISEMLTDCLSRQRKVRLAGACAVDDILIVSFEDCSRRRESRIVLAPFSSDGAENMIGEIVQRYENGFSLRSSFMAGDRLWGMFECSPADED